MNYSVSIARRLYKITDYLTNVNYFPFQVGNIFFLDTFLGGAFLTYGSDVVKFSNMNQEQRTDPMVSVIRYPESYL